MAQYTAWGGLLVVIHVNGSLWNPALWPPRLYDHLVIKTIFFWPKIKNHRVILLAELHPRAKRACGQSPIAKEMW